jgi:hypothetical protein
MCTPECGGDGDCGPNQGCKALRSVCAPRAGICRADPGTGGFCAPCLADSDCSNGYCLQADYSTERFCTSKYATGACPASGPLPGCPKRPSGANLSGIGCTGTNAPTNQCVGAVTIGSTTPGAMVANVLGCWSKHP